MGSCVGKNKKQNCKYAKKSTGNNNNNNNNSSNNIGYSKITNDDNHDASTNKPKATSCGFNTSTLERPPSKRETNSNLFNNFYRLNNLSYETFCLLKGRFEAIKVETASQREIKIYLSASYYDSLNERNYLNNHALSKFRSVYADKNYDLEIIDLHWHLENIDLINKYLYRNLISKLLDDALNNSNCIFLIFLNENLDKPLCPHKIDANDYEQFANALDKPQRDLVDRWYARRDAHYVLKHFFDFNQATERPIFDHRDDANVQLGSLFDLFNEAFDNNLKEKYLKSIQQMEIEYAIQYASKLSIVWLKRTRKPDYANTTDQQYSHVLDLLQSHVFADNYKHFVIDSNRLDSVDDYCKSEEEDDDLDLNDVHIVDYLDSLNDFVLKRCTHIIDSIVDAFQAEKIPMGIDKQLAVELYKHGEAWIQFQSNVLDSSDNTIASYAGKINASIENDIASPIVLYDQTDSLDQTYDNDLMSKILSKVIGSNQKHSTVYRFCGHTINSNNLYNLLQSVLQQLCFLFEVHESLAFNNFPQLLLNFERIFKDRYEHLESEQDNVEKTILILDRIDRLSDNFDYMNGPNDGDCYNKEIDNALTKAFEVLVAILKKHNRNFKLILTLSTGDVNTSRLYKLLRSVIDESAFIQLNMSKTKSPSQFKSSKQFLDDRIETTYNEMNAFFEETYLVNCLFEYLHSSHYGLKEIEILDLLYLSSLNMDRVSAREHETTANKNPIRFKLTKPGTNEPVYESYLVPLVWYTFKYNFVVDNPTKRCLTRLVKTYTNQAQLFYKYSDLNIRTKFARLMASNQAHLKRLQKQLIYNYFDLGPTSLNVHSTKKSKKFQYVRPLLVPINDVDNYKRTKRNLVTLRMYQEVNLHFYKYKCDRDATPDTQSAFMYEYIRMFLINQVWLYGKINQMNIFQFIGDINLCRKYLTTCVHQQLVDEFNFFVKCFFKILYRLHNDIDQVYVQLYNAFDLCLTRADGGLKTMDAYPLINELLGQLKTTTCIGHQLCPVKVERDKGETDLISLFDKHCKLTYTAFVKNSESHVISLSKTDNEIVVWNVANSQRVRCIKLNKTPKDLRFIDSHRIILLIDRNLHLFDINTCEHLNDLKTTMDRNMPFFEIHDENNLVFLDRNRLSVTLMPIPGSETTTTGNGNESLHAHYQKSKQFKVGEDRYMNSLMVSKNGKIMVCGDQVQKPFPLIVWNLFEQKLIHDLRQPRHEFITSIQAVSSSGHYVVCACQEENESKNYLVSYDLEVGTVYKKFEEEWNYVSVEISEEYNIVIGALDNGRIIIYDLCNGSKKFTFQQSKYPVNKIKLTQTSRFLTYDTKGYDWTIRLWDFNKGVLLCSYTCPSLVLDCDINSSGDTIIAGLYGYDELFVLKLSAMNTINSPKLSIQNETQSSNAPLFGDKSFTGKTCDIKV